MYWQNDSSLPGYNPNDEHAFVTDANPDPTRGRGEQAVFALRASDGAPSEPYVLLKYFEDPDPAAYDRLLGTDQEEQDDNDQTCSNAREADV